MAPKPTPQDSLRNEIGKARIVIDQSRKELEEIHGIPQMTRDPANTPPFDGKAPAPEHGNTIITGDEESLPRR
jgi:hypothetical protein